MRAGFLSVGLLRKSPPDTPESEHAQLLRDRIGIVSFQVNKVSLKPFQRLAGSRDSVLCRGSVSDAPRVQATGDARLAGGRYAELDEVPDVA